MKLISRDKLKNKKGTFAGSGSPICKISLLFSNYCLGIQTTNDETTITGAIRKFALKVAIEDQPVEKFLQEDATTNPKYKRDTSKHL